MAAPTRPDSGAQSARNRRRENLILLGWVLAICTGAIIYLMDLEGAL